MRTTSNPLSILRGVASAAAFALTMALPVIFTASPAQANIETTVHDFPDPAVISGPDGANPYGALVYDLASSNLYGTTRAGGKYGKGTVFCMNPNFGVTILHSFNGHDGANPTCALIVAPNSDRGISTLYGTTLRGGQSSRGALLNFGTVFKITTTGIFTTLHTFAGGPGDGAFPYAGVIRASDGRLYGTTILGGKANQGAVYCLNIGGGPTVITHNFAGTSAVAASDGSRPYARLFEYTKGRMVGTTTAGGDPDLGTVFNISLDGTSYGLIHTFVGGKDGMRPTAELIQVPDASGLPLLYGTTVTGGFRSGGTAYRLTPAGGSYSVIYTFGGPGDSAAIWSGLLYDDRDGLLYGTARSGGAFGDGSVFKLKPESPSPEAIIHSFDPFSSLSDGANPVAALIIDPIDGLLYSTATQQGVNFDGTVYNIFP